MPLRLVFANKNQVAVRLRVTTVRVIVMTMKAALMLTGNKSQIWI
jgi:hypothetical protein